jgi:type I restriction enzyme S subunit
MHRIQREISLLREYRTRLIANVVTGKLDVREAAARLPEEAKEPEDVGANDYSPLRTNVEDEPAEGLDAALEESEADTE